MNAVADEQVRFGDEIAEPEMVEQDGLLINPDTGEIVAASGAMDFHVDTIDGAEWVLERMAAREAAILALEARARALIENLQALKRDEERILEGLHRRFDLELHAFARAELARRGWRTKTLKTAYGQIGFRDVPSRLKVVDQEAALEWAKVHLPACVRVKESVNDSDVIAAVERFEELGFIDPGEGIVERVPAGERVTIRTNVGADR